MILQPLYLPQFSQFSPVPLLCPILCDPMDCGVPDLPVHHQVPEFTQTHVHWVSDAIQPSHPLLSPSSPAFNLSQHQSLFQWVGALIRWPKYWSFSISPSSEYSELISFRTNWFAMLAVQGTLKSLLQHRSSKASILQHSAFFMVQLSHPHTTTGKTIALTTWTFDYTELQYMFIITQHLNNTSQASWQLQSQPKRSKSEKQPNLWKSPPLPPKNSNTAPTH